MNAERLHAIARALRADLDKIGIKALLRQLQAALQNQVNQPQQPQYQQEVATNLGRAKAAAEDLADLNFSPAWKQTLEEMGLSLLVDNKLSEKINDIFAQNQITPSVAVQEIKQLADRLTEIETTLDKVIESFGILLIGNESLEPGECEIGVLIPREFVKNRLLQFGKELDALNKIFAVFEEIATGKRSGFEIRTISSSDLSIFLGSDHVTCACIAFCINKLMGFYKQLLEIRKLRAEIKQQGIKETDLKSIDVHADNVMEAGIEKIVTGIMADSAKMAAERKNEVSIELRYSLRKLADRIDRGFNIEVRMTEIIDDSEDQKSSELAKSFAKIQEASEGMRFMKIGGDPILNLSKDEKVESRNPPAKSVRRPRKSKAEVGDGNIKSD